MPPSTHALSQITPRQLEILNLVAKGLRNQEIAELLGISLSTVKVHVAAILKTLDVANRTEAVFEYRVALREEDDAMHPLATVARDIGRPAIAILPFEVEGEADEETSLVTALHQDLVRRMSKWRWFPVLSTSATRDLDSARADFRQLGGQLGAVYAVLGRIQSHGVRHRVHVELIEVASEQVLWSTRHEFREREIFEIQDLVCRTVASQIAPELVRADAQIARGEPAPGFEAWSLASKGMWHVMRATSDASVAALETIERALALDGALVMAWYAKAAAHYQRVFHQWSDSPAEDLAGFQSAASRCLELDPTDSSSHEIFGFSRLIEGRHPEAIHHLERAILLNPSNAQAYSELGQTFALSGRPDEGLAHLEEALRLAPTGDSAWSAEGGIAIAHLMAGRPAESEHWAQRAIGRDPDAAATYAILAAAQAAGGDEDLAKRTLDELARLDPGFALQRLISGARHAAPLYAERLESVFTEAGLLPTRIAQRKSRR